MKPKRIQIKRVKGWRLPKNTVVVARGPGRKWGNPFKVSRYCSNEMAVQSYRDWLHARTAFQWEIKRELKGKNLACFCPLSKPCHADVMLEVANTDKLV